MASTTIDTDTELSAVNAILGAIGQSPVTTLGTSTVDDTVEAYDNPEVAFVYNLLRDANIDTQNEGWHFNTEKHVKYTADSTTGKIIIGNDILKIDVSDGWTHRQFNVVKRNGYLYDKYDHTDDWSDSTEGIHLDVIRLYSFENLPSVFQRYIIYRASRQAATQLVANPQLVKLLAQQEGLARAACMEYECNQGNHTMFGFPEDTVYHTYQPWRNLRR
tara:strand:- start:2293 stop:2946 length:654 start_codon:yes stop_codon:yes gene_type:complete